MYIYEPPNRSPQNWDFFLYLLDCDYDIRLLCSILNKWLELELTRQKPFTNPETRIWNPAYVLSCSSVLGTVSDALLWHLLGNHVERLLSLPRYNEGTAYASSREVTKASQLVLGKASAKPRCL